MCIVCCDDYSAGTATSNAPRNCLAPRRVCVVYLPQNSMRQVPHLTRCPPPSGTIQLPHSGLMQGTAPVDWSPLRVSSVSHVSKARLLLSCSPCAASTLLPLPSPDEYVLSRKTCGQIVEQNHGTSGTTQSRAFCRRLSLPYPLLLCQPEQPTP